MKRGMKILLSIVLLSALFISCTKSGSLGGGPTQSGSFSSSVAGSVNGGLSPVIGATVALYVAGSATPLASAITSSSGAFTISYNNPGTALSALYLLVTGGSAGNRTNSNLVLAAFLGPGNNTPTGVSINEATTTGFFEAAFSYGVVNDSNGAVTFKSPNNQATMNNMVTQYNNFIANANFNSTLSTTNLTTFGTMANNVASCVEVSGNCANFFSNAQSANGGASVGILDAIYNMINGLPNITNLFAYAQSQSATTGYLVNGQPTLLNVSPIITVNTFILGNVPKGVAIDASGNAWVASSTSTTVTKFSGSGATLGTFTVGSAPQTSVIDSAGNVWVSNTSSNNVTELNSSGTTLGTFSVGSAPVGMAIDVAGNVWVTNQSGNSVTELNSSGTTVGTFSSGNGPRAIAFDASGNAWVANQVDNTVAKLNSSGTLLATIPVGSSPRVIAIDQSGNVWVTNNGSGTFTKLSSGGTTLSNFSLASPIGIAFDFTGNIWVVSNTLNKAVEYNASGISLGTFATGTTPSIGLAIDASGNIWIPNQGGNVTQLAGVTAGPEFFPYSGPQFP